MASIYKIYQGSKRLNMIGCPPLIVIVAQKDHGGASSEHHIFTGLDNPPFLYSWTDYKRDNRVTQDEFDEIATLDNIFASQFSCAAACLENLIYEKDKDLHKRIYLEGQKFDFALVDNAAFFHLAMHKKFKNEIAKMFENTQGQALEPLEKITKIASKINVKSG